MPVVGSGQPKYQRKNMSAWRVIPPSGQFFPRAREKTLDHPLGWCSRSPSFCGSGVIDANNGTDADRSHWLAESVLAGKES